MKKFILILISFMVCISSYQQTIQWQKSLGGSGNDIAQSVQQTTDGGYIIVGSTESNDGDVTGYHGQRDYWLVKTDPSGAIQWQRCLGGSSDDWASSVQQTTDGGYIIAGNTFSNDGDVTGNHGENDCWVVKTDPSGIIQWQKCFGGSISEQALEVKQTTDGGYIIFGFTTSNDGDVTGNHGEIDFWVVKINQLGVIQWQRCFGGSSADWTGSIRQTIDGGYIILGSTDSNDGDVTGNHGQRDYWLVKIDPSGAIQWQKCYGGSNLDEAYSVQQTKDGGYIIVGFTNSNNGDVTGNHGEKDFWVVKTEPSGIIQWQKCFGGSSYDYALSVQQTTDAGYIIVGSTGSNDGDVTGNHGGNDFWVVKINQLGAIQWQRCFGGSSSEWAWSVQQTTDDSYIITGSCWSNDGDVTGNHGLEDYWLVRMCFDDPLAISISNLIYCFSTNLVASNGFSTYLWNTGETTPMIKVNNGGLYSVVAVNSSGCPSKSEIVVPNPTPPSYYEEQICMVTLDDLTGKNVIVIDKTWHVGTDSILIYRMNNQTSEYQKLGSIGINELGLFIDKNSIPDQQSYQYKISVTDTCGHESDLSNMHRSILLQTYSGINNEVILSWNPYEGFNYSNFHIYRSNSGGSFILIATVANNIYTFTDHTPPSGVNKYQVRVAKEIPCNPSKSTYGYASSNISNAYPYGINEINPESFSIYPNPATISINIKVNPQLLGSAYTISDQLGRIILTGKLTSEVSNINISELSFGIYTFKIGEQNKETLKVMKK